MDQVKRKAGKASPSEKAHLAAKIRRLTPGAEDLIVRIGLEDRA